MKFQYAAQIDKWIDWCKSTFLRIMHLYRPMCGQSGEVNMQMHIPMCGSLPFYKYFKYIVNILSQRIWARIKSILCI